MGDDQHRTVGQLMVDHVKDGILRRKVEVRRRFVQNIEVRVFQKGPGQSDALFLTAGQAVAGLLQVGVILQRQLADELMGIRLLGRLFDFFQRRVRARNADIVKDGLAEKLNVLRYVGNGAAD